MHSLMISSELRPSSRSVFSCMRATTSSWLSEPPLTPIRTGLPCVDRDLADRRELLVAAAAGADVARIDAVLVERSAARGKRVSSRCPL